MCYTGKCEYECGGFNAGECGAFDHDAIKKATGQSPCYIAGMFCCEEEAMDHKKDLENGNIAKWSKAVEKLNYEFVHGK